MPPQTASDHDRAGRARGMLPLALTALVFLVFSLPPYVALDAAASRVPAPEGVAYYFPALVAHVLCGAVAMVTCCLQIWPWLRRRSPELHRRVGRVYVLAGVLPAGLVGLYLIWNTPFGPVARASGLVMAPLWLGFTALGVLRARQRRLAEHRRWMIRSFALTMSIVINRILGVPIFVVLYVFFLDTTFAGDEARLQQCGAGIVTWSSWIVALLLAERHLRRRAG